MRRRMVIWSAGIVLALLTGLGICLAQEEMPGSEAPPPLGPRSGAAGGARARNDRGAEFGGPGGRIFFGHGFGFSRAQLGVQLEDLGNEKARELKLAGEYGVLVDEVREGSPAAKAGIAKGDVILEFAGEKVRSAAQLRRLVQETPLGREVTIQVVRGGQTKTVKATVEVPQGPDGGPEEAAPLERALPALPEMPDVAEFFDFDVPDVDVMMWKKPAGMLGITGDDLNQQLAEYFGVKQGKGVLVREVVAGSAAEKAGLKAGDVIVKVNETATGSIPDLRRALPKAPGAKQQVVLTIVRDRREQTLKVELEAPKPPKPRQFAEMSMVPAV